jgi:hypothetical protein
MVPVILDAWGQATSLVLSERRVFNSPTSHVGLVGLDDAQNFTVRPRRSAIRTHGAVLASWLSFETITSSPGWNFSAVERLCRSWVVETPRLICQ